MKTHTKSLLAAAIAAGFVGSSHAAVLANYTFGGASGADSAAVTGITAGDFTAVDATPSSDIGLSSGGNAFLRTDDTGSTEADALADDKYFTVTIAAANVGEVLNLTSLTFDLGGSNGTYNNEVFVQSSVAGFGTGNAVLAGTGTTSAPTGSATNFPSTASYDLSAAAFQGLTSITFQFRLADDVNVDATVNRIDNVVLSGEVVPIPEPGSLALLGLGGLLIGARRRRGA